MERKINHGLNLLRIISMLGIIGLHVLNAGSGLVRENLLSSSNVVLSYCYIFCACSVSTFAMLTGFLYEGRTTVRYRNLLSLLVTVFFYCAVITGVLYIWDKDMIRGTGILVSLCPFLAGRFWYIACYVLLFAMIPYINILLKNLSERQYDIFVVLLLVMTSVIPTFSTMDLFRMGWGYSAAWLMVCYILGAYVKRKHALLSVRKSVVLTVVISLATLGSVLLYFKLLGKISGFDIATQYTSLSIVLISMLQINIFSKIKLPDGKFVKALAGVSAAAFDVYILHSHIIIFDNWINNGFEYLQKVQLIWLVPAFIITLGAIYVIGFLTCKIRTGLFAVTKLDVLMEKMGKLIDKKMFV